MRANGEYPWQRGLQAAKANAGPGLTLQALAVAIVVAFYTVEPFAHMLGHVADAKQRYGFAFSMISTAVFAAVVPTLVQQCRPAWRHLAPMRHLPFLLAFWAVKGAEVDLLYRLQALMFGHTAEPNVIIPKVLFDQFVYCPLIAVPGMVLVYLFKDSGYSFRRTRARLGPRWYRRRGLPLMIANWGVWIPTVICIYALPTPLQLPIQNLVLCLWSLMLLLMTHHEPIAPAVALPAVQPVGTSSSDS